MVNSFAARQRSESMNTQPAIPMTRRNVIAIWIIGCAARQFSVPPPYQTQEFKARKQSRPTLASSAQSCTRLE
jgi:hypothetical protein